MPKAPPRRFVFSMRVLLLVIAVLAIPLAYFERNFERPRRAYALVVEMGGSSQCMEDWREGPNRKFGETETWMRSWLPQCYFENLNLVNLNKSRATDKGVALLSGLVRLESLAICQTAITDKGIESLDHQSLLKNLYISRTSVSDEGLSYVAKLAALERLALDDTDITDAGLIHLTALKALRHLRLKGSKVTPEGIVKLQECLPDCEIVY